MSRFDYADPGTDPAYCDGLDADEPVIEVCPDCLGARETEQHVTDDITRVLPCRECDGRGWVEVQ